MISLEKTAKTSVIGCVLVSELFALTTCDWFYLALAVIAYALLLSFACLDPSPARTKR
jgi:hypothetical protein